MCVGNNKLIDTSKQSIIVLFSINFSTILDLKRQRLQVYYNRARAMQTWGYVQGLSAEQDSHYHARGLQPFQLEQDVFFYAKQLKRDDLLLSTHCETGLFRKRVMFSHMLMEFGFIINFSALSRLNQNLPVIKGAGKCSSQYKTSKNPSHLHISHMP